MQNPYAPLDQTGVVINDLDIGVVVNTIREQGYAVVENFLPKDAITGMRRAFNSEVPITEMRAIGTETGRTWRAHNLLAKTRAADDVFLDPRLRGIVEGVIGRYNQINVTTACGQFRARIHLFCAMPYLPLMISPKRTAQLTSCLSVIRGVSRLIRAWNRFKSKCDQAVSSFGRAACGMLAAPMSLQTKNGWGCS